MILKRSISACPREMERIIALQNGEPFPPLGERSCSMKLDNDTSTGCSSPSSSGNWSGVTVESRCDAAMLIADQGQSLQLDSQGNDSSEETL